MYPNKKTFKGFSLIELLIVIAIIAIMAGVLLTNKTNKGAIEVQSATRTVAAQLRSLQNDALNGKVIDGKIICEAQMYFNTTTEKYYIKYYDVCPLVVGQLPINNSPTGDGFTPAKSNFKLGGTTTEGTISFMVPSGQAVIDTGGTKGISLVSTSDPSQKMAVCVNSTGNIEEVKGDAASSCT